MAKKKKAPKPLLIERSFGSPIELKMRNALVNRAAAGVDGQISDHSCFDLKLTTRTEKHGRLVVGIVGCDDFNYSCALFDELEASGFHSYGDTGPALDLYGNVWIASYKIDLLIVDQRTSTALAIECDGHEWHERTKEKASADKARDRALLRLGIPTARFTGSDIFCDADACARDVFQTVAELAKRSAEYLDLQDIPVDAWHDGYGHALKVIDDQRKTAIAARMPGLLSGVC
jgi:hypothetical protein